jgi:hypothetical protein
MKSKKNETDNILNIAPLETGVAKFCLLGTTPMIQNRLAEKARMELLFPRGGRLSSSDKLANMKHDPVYEFRSAAYAPKDKAYATRLIIPARAFSKALAESALDTPGAKKTQITRLTWILAEHGVNVPVYGIPYLFMAPVRMADMKKTPDIRTRAILPEWCCFLSVRYLVPQLTVQTIGNLLARAGLLIGIGDDRHEKGGNSGMFELVAENHPIFERLIKEAGRTAQDEALAKAEPYEQESEELLSWFQSEVIRRERDKTKKDSEKEEKRKTRIPAGRNDRNRNPLTEPV